MISAARHNEVVDALASITYENGQVRPAPEPDHPWRVTAEPGPQPKTWRVRMSAGFVNDIEATVAYLVTGDPRGWTRPAKYPESRVKNGIADRSWREPEGYGQAEAAERRAPAPELWLESGRDFDEVKLRPREFQGEADVDKELFRASVFITTRLSGVYAGKGLPSRFRTWAGRLPVATGSAKLAVREIATLWLLRDTDERETVRVQQREYFDLWAAGVEPVKLLPDFRPIGGGGFGGVGLGFADGALDAFNIGANMLTEAVNAALANIAADINSVEFWSV